VSTVTRYTLRPLTPADRPTVTPILVREWGATEVVALSLGGVVDAAALPGWLAVSARPCWRSWSSTAGPRASAAST